MAGLPGGCNPADVLYKLAHGRGIKAPEFVQLSEEGPPHAKTFTWHCSFLEVKNKEGEKMGSVYFLVGRISFYQGQT